MSSSDNDDLLEEFKRETEREKIMTAEREKTRAERAIEKKKLAKDRLLAADKANKKRHKLSKSRKRSKKFRSRSNSEASSSNSSDDKDKKAVIP